MGDVAPVWLIESVLYIFAVLTVFAAAVAQRFEVRDRKLRYRLFKASKLFASSSQQALVGAAGGVQMALAPSPTAAAAAAASGRGRRISYSQAAMPQVLRTAGNAAAPGDVPAVKDWMNRCSLMVLAAQLCRSVDVHGAQGIYSRDWRDSFSRVTATTLTTIPLYVFFQNIEVGMRIMRLSVRPASRTVVFAAIGTAWFAAVATMVARVWTDAAFWTQGVWIWVLGLLVACIGVEVNVGVRLLRAAGKRFSSSTSLEIRRRLPTLAEAIDKLVATRRWVMLIVVVVVPLQFVTGLSALRSDKSVYEESQYDYSEWSLGVNAFVWIELFATAVMVWYAWLPLTSRPDHVAAVRATGRGAASSESSVSSQRFESTQ